MPDHSGKGPTSWTPLTMVTNFPSLICRAPWEKPAPLCICQSWDSRMRSSEPLVIFLAFSTPVPFTATHKHMRAVGKLELRGHNSQQPSQVVPAMSHRGDSSTRLTTNSHRGGQGWGSLGRLFFALLMSFWWHSICCFLLLFLVYRSKTPKHLFH